MRRNNACKNCGSTTFIVDRNSAAGDLSCSKCGSVQEENPIVSEVQFGETSTGAATVQGSMVGADQARASFGGRQNALESREQTLLNGKRRIERIAAAMKIPSYIATSAGEWFRLALAQNFVQGRRSQNVLATCLYVACRKEKTHHMLIDFSSRIQILVYLLGATYLKMVKALCITKLPLADPSLFIQHFAEKLDFKDQCTKVVRDAVKLAQRMLNDWIHEGRRPAGIAGACVLLAARMNNFQRSHAEIVAVAHVGSETIQRRLNEFRSTASGKLTVSLFRDSNATASANPPSFDKNRRLEKELQAEIDGKLRMMETLRRAQAGLPAEKVAEVAGYDVESTPECTPDSTSIKLSKRALRAEQERQVSMARFLENGVSVNEISEEIERIINRKKSHLAGSMYVTPLEQQKIDSMARRIEINWPRNLQKNLPRSSDLLSTVSLQEELNSEDDDDVVDEMQMTEQEVEDKTRIWTGLNLDFLMEQERKRLKAEADEATGNTSGLTRRKRRKVPKEVDRLGVNAEVLEEIGVDADGVALSAADSAKMVLQKKSFLKKINYDTLNDLFNK